jgi:hypothetical protein
MEKSKKRKKSGEKYEPRKIMSIEKMKHVLGLLIINSIAFLCCCQNSHNSSPPKNPTPTSPPTRTFKPTKTSQPSLTPKPTQISSIEVEEILKTPTIEQINPTESSSKQIFLPLEIVFQGGGGSGEGCWAWVDYDNYEFPAVILFNLGSIYTDIGRSTPGFKVCLVNMPINTSLLVFFSNADEKVLLLGEFSTDFGSSDGSQLIWQIPENIRMGNADKWGDGKSLFDFNLWWPNDLPSGNWQIEVINTENSEIISSAEYKITQDESPWIEATAEKTDSYSLHPVWGFNRNFPYCRDLSSYEIGDQVTISGAGFLPEIQLQVGIYDNWSQNDMNFSLLSEKTVLTDENGEFSFVFPPGLLSIGKTFNVYAIWDPNYELSKEGLVEFGGIETCFTLPEN